MKRSGWMIFGVISVACTVLQAQADGATAYFQGLGDLSGGDFHSSARDVSADGSVVVGSSRSSSGSEGFYWTLEGGLIGLGDLPGGAFGSGASAVSADGSIVVGGATSESGKEAYRWTADSGMVALGELAGGDYFSRASDVSDDGRVVVGLSRSANGMEAFRFTDSGGMVGLGDLPGSDFRSVANGVSADGSVVVGTGILGVPGTYEEIRLNQAYVWSETDGMLGLGAGHFGTDISADGSVIVGWSGGPLGSLSPFRWTSDSGVVPMNPPGSTIEFSRAFAVSGDGSVVVGDNFDSGPPMAAIWDEVHGTRLLREVLVDDLGLDLTGWTLGMAEGVSYDGQTIVGWGTNPDGHTEAFIARLPEPGTVGLMVLGLAALLRRRGFA